MPHKYSSTDYAVILPGCVALGLAIWTILGTHSDFISPWYIAACFAVALVLAALVIGLLIARVTKSKIPVLSATAFVVTVGCLVFFINHFRTR